MVMPFSTLTLVLALQSSQSSAVSLTHEFKLGEKLAYQVLSHITSERRGAGLDTWIPSDLDINYNFSFTVDKMQSDGIALIHYVRPTMTEITGETFDNPPKTTVRPVNFNSLVTVSPINEILEVKDLPKSTKDESFQHVDLTSRQGAMNFFLPFISDVHRLALFIGSVQDALDFSPKFPLRPIKVGDTWEKTVGFQPQALKGPSGKQAVQRLDYTYTYLGPVVSHGKNVLRVQGKLKFASDAAAYFKQILADRASETNVSKVPIRFESVINFDLDPVTRDLLEGDGSTEGGFQVFIMETGDTAATEEKFKGRTTIELVGKKLSSMSNK